jgi:hypothetical protein
MSRGQNGAIAGLEQILGDLEEALRRGRVEGLAPLQDRMQSAVQALATDAAHPALRARLEVLRARTARAARMLAAAQAGLRDARAAMALPKGFASYDAQGRMERVSPPRTSVEHRR